MSVLLPNGTATVSVRVPGALNSHGEETASGYATPGALLPALIEQSAQGAWTACIDDSFWPVRVGDRVVDQTGRRFQIITANLLTNSLDPSVNYVLCSVVRVGDAGGEPLEAAMAGSDDTR